MAEFFNTKEELSHVFNAFLSKVAVDPLVGALVAKVNFILRLSLADPDAEFTLHIGDPTGIDKGVFISFETDENKPAVTHKDPEAVLNLPADLMHRFWLGMENLGLAVVNGKIKVSGNYIKALVLLPAVKPFFRTYRELLKESGLDRLIPSAPD